MRIFLISTLLISINSVLLGQIDSVFILCDSTNFNKLYDNYLEDAYINCDVNYEGELYKSKIRIRGSSSRNFPKKSLKIKIDLFGSKKILNLNADYLDKSYMHQYLSSLLYKKMGQISFDCAHKIVFLNNQLLGIYIEVENIDTTFLRRNNLNSGGDLYKASKDYANLSWFDDADYYWEKKTNKHHNNTSLKNTIYDLNVVPYQKFYDYVNKNFNYNNLISSVALNSLIGNGSTYYHNYFLHNNPFDNKWYYLPWDLDKTMGSYNKYLRYDYCSWSDTLSGAMPENPLLKKLFLNSKTSSDLLNKIHELTQTFYNPKTLYPIIDSLSILLKPYINLDQYDQLSSVEEWEKEVEKIKQYIVDRPIQIQYQVKNTPSPFYLHNNYNHLFKNIVQLSWSPSFINQKICNNYSVKISDSKLFDTKNTRIYKNIKDTFLVDSLDIGRYYWHVNAQEKEYKNNGYNSRNIFWVGEFDFLKDTITKKTVIENKNIIIDRNLIIEPNGELIIKGNSKIQITPNCKILNFGKLKIIGSENESVVIKCSDEYFSWGGIYSEGFIDLKYVDFMQVEGESIVRQIGGEAKMTNCRATYNSVRETVSFNHCPVKITNNYFNTNGGEGILFLDCSGVATNNSVLNIKDAIEATNCNNMKITNNFILNSGDDGIDVNYGFNISVSNNTIIKSSDKGISLTLDSLSILNLIHDNILMSNHIGIGLEGNGTAMLNNNTYQKNNTKIFIEHPKTITINSKKQNIGTKNIIYILVFFITVLLFINVFLRKNLNNK